MITKRLTLIKRDPMTNTLCRVCIKGSPTIGYSIGRFLTDSDIFASNISLSLSQW
jgi:hypothetical protein